MSSILDALKGANDAEGFLKLLGEKDNSLKAEIKYFGGRRFSKEGYTGTIALSDVVHCAEGILKTEPSQEQKLRIVQQIRHLDELGNKMLEESPGATRFAHSFHKAFGSGFSEKERNRKLSEMGDIGGAVLDNFRRNIRLSNEEYKTIKEALGKAVIDASNDKRESSFNSKVEHYFKGYISSLNLSLQSNQTAHDELEHALNEAYSIMLLRAMDSHDYSNLQEPVEHPYERGARIQRENENFDLGQAIWQKFKPSSPKVDELKQLFKISISNVPLNLSQRQYIDKIKENFEKKLEGHTKEFEFTTTERENIINASHKAITQGIKSKIIPTRRRR